ncbi:MAG TPA: sulfoxide reductase heme-binding subunit YedZ, partial [Candidatus Angelobacter sp.]|nr:sulfoxide reductase heme-binding subunit YedZ [Candidatus Angelobacter sp.]
IRWLGKRWQVLHRLVYATAVLGVIHYIWLVKKDLRKPLIYAAILAALLLYRLVVRAVECLSSGSGESKTLSALKRSTVAVE